MYARVAELGRRRVDLGAREPFEHNLPPRFAPWPLDDSVTQRASDGTESISRIQWCHPLVVRIVSLKATGRTPARYGGETMRRFVPVAIAALLLAAGWTNSALAQKR